jgi:2-iminobutanoate/2-iminopropanoate deaminase
MSGKREIRTPGAPAAIGPYAQAVVSGGFLWSAGQIGLDPRSGELVDADVEAQARRVFANLREVLGAAGAGFGDVVKTTVYLADMADFAAVNAIYAEHFEEPYPARSTVEAARLPKDARVEIDVVARVP